MRAMPLDLLKQIKSQKVDLRDRKVLRKIMCYPHEAGVYNSKKERLVNLEQVTKHGPASSIKLTSHGEKRLSW
jgi:hypothetical protein